MDAALLELDATRRASTTEAEAACRALVAALRAVLAASAALHVAARAAGVTVAPDLHPTLVEQRLGRAVARTAKLLAPHRRWGGIVFPSRWGAASEPWDNPAATEIEPTDERNLRHGHIEAR